MTLAAADGPVTIEIPSDAVDGEGGIEIAAREAPEGIPVHLRLEGSQVYEITTTVTFDRDVRVTIPVPDGIDPDRAYTLMWLDDETWTTIPSYVDEDEGTVTGYLDHFSTIGVFSSGGASACAGQYTGIFSGWTHGIVRVELSEDGVFTGVWTWEDAEEGEGNEVEAEIAVDGTITGSYGAQGRFDVFSEECLARGTWQSWVRGTWTIVRGSDGADRIVHAPYIFPGSQTITEPIDVALACQTEGATIRYTTDFSMPTAEHGIIYDPKSPIRVSDTTTIRAIAYKEGMIISNRVSATYTKGPGQFELDWETPASLDVIVFEPYGGFGYKTQPKLLSSSTMDNFKWIRHYGGDFIYFPEPNILWFAFHYVSTSDGLFNQFHPVLDMKFQPRWVRVFQAQSSEGGYTAELVTVQPHDDYWIAELGLVDTTPDFGPEGLIAVVEMGLPEFSDRVYWEIIVHNERDLEWWESFLEWATDKAFGRFFSILEATGIMNTPGNISDVFEVYLERNATGDMVNSRDPTLWEQAKAFWDWLQNVKAFWPG